MQASFYLVVSKDRDVRIFKKRPAGLKMSEVLVSMSVEVPDEIFERPQLRARLTVDKDAVPPVEISQDLKIKAADLLRAQTGLRVEFVKEPLPAPPQDPAAEAKPMAQGEDLPRIREAAQNA